MSVLLNTKYFPSAFPVRPESIYVSAVEAFSVAIKNVVCAEDIPLDTNTYKSQCESGFRGKQRHYTNMSRFTNNLHLFMLEVADT